MKSVNSTTFEGETESLEVHPSDSSTDEAPPRPRPRPNVDGINKVEEFLAGKDLPWYIQPCNLQPGESTKAHECSAPDSSQGSKDHKDDKGHEAPAPARSDKVNDGGPDKTDGGTKDGEAKEGAGGATIRP